MIAKVVALMLFVLVFVLLCYGMEWPSLRCVVAIAFVLFFYELLLLGFTLVTFCDELLLPFGVDLIHGLVCTFVILFL